MIGLGVRLFSPGRRGRIVGAIGPHFLHDHGACLFAQVQAHLLVGSEMNTSLKAGFCPIFGSLLEVVALCGEKRVFGKVWHT